jgi:nitrogen regulatory protein P-II 1
MRKIEAILRPEKLDAVRKALDASGYPGLMITEIEGHGRQRGIAQQWRGEQYRMDLLPKVKLELVVPDKDVDRIVKTIMEHASTGAVGDGKIFIYPVAEAIRIRTGERGEVAL